ncbi:LpqB family beta-propeller domain-containing protein [Pauljensenia sp. UMB0018B]|uniref:Sporulation protein n=1 Tax=Schaalia odontolytica TaxID=1660 RepID=A0A2I1I131_9ACTO|nr:MULTISPECIES: LpqB family beta-propeller domain-containing protein [Actinomycetaceae]MDK7339590.1 LpqB family beta-propeller domain-containing protein [Pauljensenia sp. UMB0018B]PKY64789.1 sporulation protein [Schaalia odontolytica]
MKRRLMPLALAACLALAGCTSLPTSSAPAPFDVSAKDGSGIQFSAEGPSADADAATLVNDFLLACAAGPQDDYATARLFLSAASARSWQPETEILVYDTDTAPSVTAGSETATQVDVTVAVLGVASVDAFGVLTRVAASTVSRTFTLVREEGQWRINNPENMVLMSRASFTASFSLANLYFPTAEGGDLVADPRWYPSRRLASHLLAGLVEGPRQSLAPVTANAIPAGTTVPSQGLDVADGVARVELNAVMPSSESARTTLAWELVRTLTQVADVSRVNASLSGDVLDTQAIPVPPTYSLDTLVGAGPGGVGLVSSSSVTELAAVTDASNPTVSPVDSSLVAWSGTDGVYAQRGGTTVAFLPGQAPLGPSVDRFGWVWGPATVSSVSVGGGVDGAFSVSVESESAGQIRAVRISPDGTRALVLRGSDATAWVGVVERGASGRPLAIRSLEEIPLEHGSVVDASWTTPTGLALVVRATGEDDQLVTMPLGGLPSNVSLPIHVTSMSAGGSSSAVVITGTDAAGMEQVLIRSGALWQNAPDTLTSARYAG